MFKSISWQQFLTAAIILVATYYLVVAILFYRREIRQLAAIRKGSRVATQPLNATSTEDEQFAQAALLKTSVEEIIQMAVHQSWVKDELLIGLASRLELYPDLKNTPFQIAINNHISEQTQVKCNIVLHASDLKLIW
jgi:hypothetical protein